MTETERGRPVPRDPQVEAAVAGAYLVERILKEISDVVRSIDEPQRVMDELVRLTTTLLNVGTCSLVMVQPDSEDMCIRAAFGLDEKVIHGFRQRVGEGITGHVAKTGKPLLIENVETHPMFRRTSRSHYHTKSLLSVPLIANQNVIGVLNVNNKNDGSVFTQADELLLSVLANFVVIAIDKAHMRERLRETERYEADLRVAREIQELMLPSDLPVHEDWEYAARNLPARAVAGDFFDVRPLRSGRTLLLVGDVCGKGVPAALYMARVLGYFRVLAHVYDTADEIMGFANQFLAAEWSERTFVTAVLCVLDRQASRVTFCSAGHPAPYRLRQSTGELEALQLDPGLPLGVDEESKYCSVEIEALPGDTFVLFTDGITDARNGAGEIYGLGRLEQLIAAHRGHAQLLSDAIFSRVEEFANGVAQQDDQTLMVMKRI